jgi:ATPase subunit of ABC transporter with duplicated ATPase domains
MRNSARHTGLLERDTRWPAEFSSSAKRVKKRAKGDGSIWEHGGMTATLVAKGLAGGHAHRVLFDSLDVTVAPGDVVGVVGVNGAGKSTLLRILAGLDAPLEGTVALAPSDAFIGWLPQEHERVEGETVSGHVGRRTGCAEATREMDAAASALGDIAPPAPGSPDPADVYSAALERWLASGAADLDERLPVVLSELGLGISGDALMTSLSGGQAARVGLAALLLSRFDIVLLDEPTNDLDLDGLERLEAFIRGLRGGVLLVSHDREFLARCVTRVVELDLAQGMTTVFGGGYDSYLEERETKRRHAREEYDEFAEKKADLVGRARIQREWSSQGVRNAMKKAPDNDKNRRRASIESSEKQAQKVRQMESRIARLEEVDEPRKEWQLQFTIGSAPRGSAVVSTLSAAVVRQGGFTLGPVSLQVNAGDRIGITGPNGAGKSTLLALLLGRRAPDEGTASLGASVAIGEIDQARAVLAGGRPLAESFEEQVPSLPTGEVRTLLAKFGLKADHVNRPVDELSPGERTRAALALLQARGVNLLVLDEPTNHLDLAAIEQLEEALESYEGTLLLVTHDRRMLETVRLDRHWAVDAGTVRSTG